MKASTEVAGSAPPPLREARRAARAAFIGTTIEWYDFYIYASTATLVFGREFFPSLSGTAATLASFATISVAFVARPLGGVIFAHFGDRIGRKATLIASLLLMGTSTTLVGLLPGYQSIGMWAPVLLVVLRFLQGVAVGGEWGGAVLIATEFAPPDRRARLSSWPQQGVTAGLALSTALLLLVSVVIPEDAYVAWGWRLAFLFSTVLIVLGLVLRLRIKESPVFEARRERVRQQSGEEGLPIARLFRESRRTTVLAMVTYLAVSTTFYVPFTFLLSHATTVLEISQPVALTSVLVAAGVYSIGMRLGAGLADRRGRRTAMLTGLIGSIVAVFPMVALVETGSPVLFAVGLALFVLPVGCVYAPVGVYFAELFPTATRYSGVTVANQGGSLFGAAIAPFVAVALYNAFGMYAVGGYLAVTAVLSAVAVCLLGETRHLAIDR
ncbi:MFS transporter [Pseudonocardia spinosispora]|uniref:MFS transporter n=1 Tax=Pseudonocardia spinosispora TaxID=103441 RepID=UPI0004072DD2|nr:MFS transporter [Pseudonocardia spinosispora]